VKFAKYLPLFGWRPVVLTVKRREDLLESSDWSLFADCPKDMRVFRTRILEPYDMYSWLGGKKKQGSGVFYFENTDTFTGKISNLISRCLIPDTKVGWYPFSIRNSKEIFQEIDIHIIFSTSPKMTAHLIGRTLAKKYHRPWVADFRDPWTSWEDEQPRLFRQINEYLESKVVNDADRITSVMGEINQDFMHRYPGVDPDKFATISHGFDSEDFENVIAKRFSKFTIVFLGTFYKGRDPQPLLRALNLLVRENEKVRDDVQVVCVGTEYYNTRRLANKFGLEDMLISIPHVPYKESLSYLMGAHICYFNTVMTRNALPVKLFDYLRSGKPILAIVPEDSPTGRIVYDTKCGVVLDPSKTGEIAKSILSFYKDYKKGISTMRREDKSVLEHYERKNQTEQLAWTLNQLL
jgi:glycosyltransferase involved in cell wall biosynthesis